MGVLNLVIKNYLWFKKFYNTKSIIRHQRKKMKDSRRMAIVHNTVLTKAQEQQVQNYFTKNYGKKICTDWHRYYQGVSGKFAIDYMPELYYALYESQVNSYEYAYAYSDKILQYELILNMPNLKPAELYLYNRNGVWYDSHFQVVSINEGKEIIRSVNKVFYKPINDTSSGVGCGVFDVNNKTDEEVLLFLTTHKNVMLQKVVVNAEDVKKLHPQSLNTFRIMTYCLDGEVYHCPALIRIGLGNSNIDNAHAGGIFVGVDDDGKLRATAHKEFGENYNKHPDTGILFDGYIIDKVPQLLETLRKAHNFVQHLGVISWDAVIDENGDFVIIEINTRGQSPWLVQMASGCGMFGENTGRILNKIKV